MKTKNLLIGIAIVIGFSFTTVAQVVPSYVPTNGLVGWWPFNGNANDESGNGLNGNVTGALLTVDRNSQVNKAFDFDFASASFGQQNDEIYIPYNSQLNVNNITVSVWLNPRSYFWTGDAANPNSVILNRFQYTYSTPSGGAWGISFNQSSITASIVGPTGTTGGASAVSNTPLTLNNWHHLVMTYNGANIKLYVDGILSATQSHTAAMNIAGNSGISIGESNQANGYWGHTDGKLDDIAIWNRALTQAEITTLYNGTNPTTCLPSYVPTNGLVGFWPFCGNANDESGNSLNGNVIGALATSDRNSQTNKAYDFNFTGANFGQQNDEIYIPYNSQLNVNNITVSVWLNPRSYFWTGDAANPNSVILNRFQYTYSTPSGGTWGISFNQTSVTASIVGPTGTTGGASAVSNAPITLNAWHHLVMTYNGASIKLYQSEIIFSPILVV